ncbi:2-oxoacid:ferredoxin oxidoreductase subunit beta [Patescibacteria group bacterium]|nr:2-oxoacid:ferredoxin oxidoreductase subunit beta [Patescibacteria group bacterium]
MTNINDFSGYNPTWCPGCGDWGIGLSIKQAFVQLGYDPSSVAVVFGIGCSGNMNDFINAYAMHSLHGRALPNAIGIKLANHNLPVVAIVGDGDCYGEGGNHLLHACRGNHDITVIVHDNSVYGLTTGQVAPTAAKGFKSKSTPSGIIEVPINPMALALINGATFVAQSFAGDMATMVSLIKAGIAHKGFSLINILQPCVTFNKINTFQYYLQRVYKLPQDYKKDDLKEALGKSLEVGQEKFPLGVLYQVERPSFTDQIDQLKDQTLVSRERFADFQNLYQDFI